MNEIKGNVFDYIGQVDAICITTNGFVRPNGSCVMGKGCALTAMKKFPGIDIVLGGQLKQYGNHVFRLIEHRNTWICSFPVKDISTSFDDDNPSNVVKHMQGNFKHGDAVPGWAMVADPFIISQSMNRLIHMADHFGWKKVIIPQPGCGAGELDWPLVCSILEPLIRDDKRFYFISLN